MHIEEYFVIDDVYMTFIKVMQCHDVQLTFMLIFYLSDFIGKFFTFFPTQSSK